jgi:hypothetical protein
MAFLTAGGAPTIFLEIGDKSKSKLVRPLVQSPIQIWGHNVQSVEVAVQVNGAIEKARLRDYHYEQCVAIDRRGTGCTLCNSVDPGWNMLDPKNQTNKKGQRVDFGKKPVWLLPVWSYADQAIRVLRGGNQVYEQMDDWDTQGKNIMDCDWMLWKEQIGQQRQQVEYKSSRQDSTAFTAASVTQDQIKEAMAEALKNYNPLPPDKLFEKMAVLSIEEGTKRLLEAKARSNPALQGAPTQPALPAASTPASPFGAAPTANMPAAPLPQLPPAVVTPQTVPTAAPGSVATPVPTPTPVVDDTPPPGIPAALWATFSPEQKAMMKPASVGVTPSAPLAQAAAPSASPVAPGFTALPQNVVPTQPVQVTSPTVVQSASTSIPVPVTSIPAALPQVAVNATVATPAPAPASPVVSQPAPTATSPSNPGDFVLPSGKHQGKRLADVATTDPNYPKFFRSTQKDPAVVAILTAFIEAKPAMPAPVATVASTPAPTGQAPVVVQVVPTAAAVDEKGQLVQDCRQLISSIPRFKGAGMGTNLVPFLRTNFGRFDYTSWETPDLQKLKVLLLKETGGQIPAVLQVNA